MRFRASRQFVWLALVAVGIAVFSGSVALRWDYAWIAASLALASAILLFLLALQPAIEIYASHLKIGRRQISWAKIRRLDRAARMPLVMRITLADRKEVMLIYAGDAESVNSLVLQLRSHSREALIDGVPYREFWGDELSAISDQAQVMPAPRYPLLLEDDEAEVERMFQRLRSGGKLEDGGPNPQGPGPNAPTPKTSGEGQ